MVGRPLTENELVERARAGDGHAYATLVRDHEETAFRIAYVICGNAADAEEAAQEAFVKAYRALGRLLGVSGIAADDVRDAEGGLLMVADERRVRGSVTGACALDQLELCQWSAHHHRLVQR